MGVLESLLNLCQGVVLGGARHDTSRLEEVVRGTFLELVSDLTEVVEHREVGLADPGQLWLALRTHGGVAGTVLVVLVSEEVGPVSVQILKVGLVVGVQSRVVLLHHRFDLFTSVSGDAADRRAELRVGSIAVVGPQTVDGGRVLRSVVGGISCVGGPERRAEHQTALLAAFDERTVEAARASARCRDIVRSVARELETGFGASS